MWRLRLEVRWWLLAHFLCRWEVLGCLHLLDSRDIPSSKLSYILAVQVAPNAYPQRSPFYISDPLRPTTLNTPVKWWLHSCYLPTHRVYTCWLVKRFCKHCIGCSSSVIHTKKADKQGQLFDWVYYMYGVKADFCWGSLSQKPTTNCQAGRSQANTRSNWGFITSTTPRPPHNI